jgi:acetoin utilization deacetylase AcuC-like enzyme
MKIIYHAKFLTDYLTAHVENPGRVAAIHAALEPHYPMITPEAAGEEDLLLVHSPALVREVRNDSVLYEVAALAAGGAKQAAALALAGEPAFALIRPPGHHASPGSHWGFCFFNNIAIAIERLRQDQAVDRALILDIDLHYGDGTANFFAHRTDVDVINIESSTRTNFLQEVEEALQSRRGYDIIGVSAGFDTYRKDWGGILETEDYRRIGRWVQEAALAVCRGRRFAVLEGGYYLPDLGSNCLAFLQGLEEID